MSAGFGRQVWIKKRALRMATYDYAMVKLESLGDSEPTGLGKVLEDCSTTTETLPRKTSPYGDSSRSEMIAFVPKDVRRVLDVGCHFGAFGRSIKARSSVEVWGVEPNPAAADIAAKSLDLVFNDLFSEKLPIPDQYFDAIVFNDVLEHMPDPWEALRLANQKLARNGCVIVSIPNLRHIENLVHILKERDFEYVDRGIRDKTHLRFFTEKSARRLFDDSGLKIVHIQGINEDWWRPSLRRRLAFRFFNKYLADTKYVQLAIIAKKAD